MTQLRLMRRGIWPTVQGEGLFAGVPSVFLRTAGCNKRCTWCDTPRSLPDFDHEKGKFLPVATTAAELVELAKVDGILEAYPHYEHLVVTGGEPLLQREALGKLSSISKHYITVETNGTIHPDRERFCLHVNHVSLSPKMDDISTRADHLQAVGSNWRDLCTTQLKIVVTSLQEAFRAIDFLRDSAYYNPSWKAIQIESSWLRQGWLSSSEKMDLVDAAAEHDVRVVAQMHPVLKLP